MPDPAPLADSPVEPAAPVVLVSGWRVSGRRSRADLRLTDCSPLAKVAVRAAENGDLARALAIPFGRAGRRDRTLRGEGADVLVTSGGPGEWLLLGPPGSAPDLLRAAETTAQEVAGEEVAGGHPAELISVVDLTHGRALVRLTGRRGPDLLARECAVDLGEPTCPNGTALRTAVAGVATDVVRDDAAGEPSYLLHCERSSGQYLADCLLEAGADLGVEVDGFSWPPG